MSSRPVGSGPSGSIGDHSAEGHTARLSFVPQSAPNHWNSFDLGRYQGVDDVVDASDQCS